MLHIAVTLHSNILYLVTSSLTALLLHDDVTLHVCTHLKELSYTKNEYNHFYQKLDAEYFLFNSFFKKSNIFRENSEKLFWEDI